MKVFYLGSNDKKNAGKEQGQDKIQARFAEWKQNTNSFKIKCYNVKRKLNNLEQVQMEY